MGLPQLETCCFVFDLKTGNIVLGCINAFLSFIMTVVCIVVASQFGALETEISNSEVPVDPEVKAVATGVYAMTIILVLMFLAKFLFDVYFVYGVVKERAGVIKAYMIMWIVFIILSLFLFFLNILHYSALHICSQLFYIGINCYSILLNNSFYRTLNNREEV